MRVIRTHRRPRRGIVLIIVLTLVLVVILVLVGLLRLLAAEARQAQGRERHFQSAWLAESGIERAMMRLRQTSDYSGETWQVSADDLRRDRPGEGAAEIKIQIEPVPGQQDQRTVNVVSVYPADRTHRARCEKTVRVRIDHSDS